jgi:hypothetical protein
LAVGWWQSLKLCSLVNPSAMTAKSATCMPSIAADMRPAAFNCATYCTFPSFPEEAFSPVVTLASFGLSYHSEQ